MSSEIIKKAKKVFSGVIWDIYQWEQEMFDGSFKTFEMAYRHNSVAIIPIVGDKILIQKEKHPHWTESKLAIPAGESDHPGIPPIEDAKRELLEETGYASDNWILWKETIESQKLHWPIRVFIARDCVDTGETNPDTGGEQIETMLVDFDEFLKLVVFDKSFRNKEIVPDCIHAFYNKEKYNELKEIFFGK